MKAKGWMLLLAWVNAISFSSQRVQRTWTETVRVIRNLLIRSTLISDSTVWEATGQEVSVIHNRATLNLFNHSPQHRRSVVRPSKLSWKATQGLKPIVTQHDCWGIAISFKPWVANGQKKTDNPGYWTSVHVLKKQRRSLKNRSYSIQAPP